MFKFGDRDDRRHPPLKNLVLDGIIQLRRGENESPLELAKSVSNTYKQMQLGYCVMEVAMKRCLW